MGFFFTSCYTIWFVIISLSFSSIFQACYAYDPKSLEDFLYDYTYRSLEIMPQLGTLYNIDLPSNFTGMKISFIRLSIETFWKGGANFTSFYIPPKAITEPNVKIIAIVYANLGNWSSFYLKVPNYTFVAPIIGFMAYESPNYFELGNRKLIFNLEEKPISIRFSELINGTNLTPKCIQFDDIGRYEIKNMTEANVCFASGQAQYFSLVVPSTGTSLLLPKKKKRYWKSWVIGIFGGIFGLIFFGSVIMVIMKKYKLRSMEKQSEKDLSFDTFWVGRSKMPSASMVRTQPSIEHEDAP